MLNRSNRDNAIHMIFLMSDDSDKKTVKHTSTVMKRI